MGYDLHTTRATDWTQNRGHEIDSSEWLALVRDDPELTPDPSYGPHAVRWTSAWFDWYEGNVFTTDPTRATVTKMLQIAETLSGVVQGDDGEFYESARQWPPQGQAQEQAGLAERSPPKDP